MTVIFKLEDIEFEWDDEKYAVNLRKHNVKFEKAVEVFFDELSRFGDASVDEEAREFIIGFTFNFDLLFTVFVERGERFRIISARQATAEEENIMQGKNEKLITPEGFELKFYERESVEIKLNIPKDVLENLQNIADQKEMSVESVLKFFIGQGLRKELNPKTASDLVRKRLNTRKNGEEQSEIDLAA